MVFSLLSSEFVFRTEKMLCYPVLYVYTEICGILSVQTLHIYIKCKHESSSSSHIDAKLYLSSL